MHKCIVLIYEIFKTEMLGLKATTLNIQAL